MFAKNACSASGVVKTTMAIGLIGLLCAGMTAGQSGGKPAPAKLANGAATLPAGAVKVPDAPSPLTGGLPRMETFLVAALERHPEVVVARSKVEAARAEQIKAEAAALTELMQLHQRAQAKRAIVEAWRKQNGNAKDEAGSQLHVAAGELNLLEWEVALALGLHVGSRPVAQPAALPSENADPFAPAAPVDFVDIAYPKGDMAAQVKTALAVKLEVELIEANLGEVCDLIVEKAGIQVVVDQTGLGDSGYEVGTPNITIRPTEISVASLLQQIEDRYRPLYFVVRDYGILVTVEESAPADAVSIRDFANLTEVEIRDKYRAKQEAITRAMGGARSGGGGFF